MDDHPRIRAFMTAAAVFAVLWAFFSTPLLRFADPIFLALCGTAIAVGAGVAWLKVGNHRPWEGVAGLVLTGVGIVGLGLLVHAAIRSSNANDSRCVELQNDMLSASPLRSDGPALFQALGCRPQGVGGVAVKSQRITQSGDVTADTPPDTRFEEARTALTAAELKELRKDLQRAEAGGTVSAENNHAGHQKIQP